MSNVRQNKKQKKQQQQQMMLKSGKCLKFYGAEIIFIAGQQ